MDSFVGSLIDTVFGAFGYGIWWALRKARIVRSELGSGGAQVLGGAVALGLSVVAILAFW